MLNELFLLKLFTLILFAFCYPYLCLAVFIYFLVFVVSILKYISFLLAFIKETIFYLSCLVGDKSIKLKDKFILGLAVTLKLLFWMTLYICCFLLFLFIIHNLF